MQHAHIITYGCQMNEHDSEQIAGVLGATGYTMTTEPEAADLILVNTCSIREKAEHKLYSRLGKLRELKQARPNLLLGVCGCVAQQEGERILQKMPYVNLVMGTKAIPHLPTILRKLETRSHVVELDEYAWEAESSQTERECRFKAFITIIRGCNNFCSYCVVPYTRGREESRPAADIVQEAQHLVQDGAQEITLLGQNVSSYTDPTHEVSAFPGLLEKVHEVEGLERLRFITAHPKDLSDVLVETMARLPKVCNHFHLPFQAGSNRILKLMNRRYTREWYLRWVQRLRSAIPEIALTTDVIVGFPGEREEDFQQTLTLLQVVRYDGIFAFHYSNRPNATAASLPDQVPDEVKHARLQQVLTLQRRISLGKHRTLVGKTVEVLPETINPRFPDTLTGRTSANHLVTFPASPDLLGRLVQVVITEAHPFRVAGELVKS